MVQTVADAREQHPLLLHLARRRTIHYRLPTSRDACSTCCLAPSYGLPTLPHHHCCLPPFLPYCLAGTRPTSARADAPTYRFWLPGRKPRAGKRLTSLPGRFAKGALSFGRSAACRWRGQQLRRTLAFTHCGKEGEDNGDAWTGAGKTNSLVKSRHVDESKLWRRVVTKGALLPLRWRLYFYPHCLDSRFGASQHSTLPRYLPLLHLAPALNTFASAAALHEHATHTPPHLHPHHAHGAL